MEHLLVWFYFSPFLQIKFVILQQFSLFHIEIYWVSQKCISWDNIFLLLIHLVFHVYIVYIYIYLCIKVCIILALQSSNNQIKLKIFRAWLLPLRNIHNIPSLTSLLFFPPFEENSLREAAKNISFSGPATKRGWGK